MNTVRYKKLIPELIVVHCSATNPTQDIGAEEIDHWHRNKGWFSIGYHFVIRRDGTLEEGRPLDTPGAHASGHNHNTIGVCLVGGVDADGNPEDNFTQEQWDSLYGVVTSLLINHPSIFDICGHRDLPDVKKACPCFDVQSWVERRESVMQLLEANASTGETS